MAKRRKHDVATIEAALAMIETAIQEMAQRIAYQLTDLERRVERLEDQKGRKP